MNEYPKDEELHQSEKLSIFWQIQIAISLDRKKINAFCLFYSIMYSLGLQDIIVDNVVSKNNFLRNILMRAHCATKTTSSNRSQKERSSHIFFFYQG